MIRSILDIYIFLLIIDVILSYLPQFKNYPAVLYINKAANLTCAPARKLLKQVVPGDFAFDFSPFVVIVGIKLLELLW